jgi:hypothetical protein
MVETLWKMLFAEFFDERRIGQIRLGDEFLGGMVVFFLLPVDGDLRFGELLFALRYFRV